MQKPLAVLPLPANSCDVCQPATLAALIQSEPGLAALWQALPRRRFGAGALLLRAAEDSIRCWHLQSGVVRLFYLNDHGTERNRSFHDAGSWVAGSLPPLIQPSPYAIEALTPVQAVELTYTTLQQWQRSFPGIAPLLDDALCYLFHQNAQREAELLSYPPEVRYQSFLAAHGDLALGLPQHHVASYLGISPVSLSRIRGRLGLLDTQRSVQATFSGPVPRR